ncbi:hypothetical protein F5884DRAFT_759014 [Xylogone sp. PMI_703]|nr:hypothetical protein F5884DRAFT_759014 [Xylogone sp. PMI_703]
MRLSYLIFFGLLSSSSAHPHQYHKRQEIIWITHTSYVTKIFCITETSDTLSAYQSVSPPSPHSVPSEPAPTSASQIPCLTYGSALIPVSKTTGSGPRLSTPADLSSGVKAYQQLSSQSANLALSNSIPEPSAVVCSSRYPCMGDMTYYIAGLGACGSVNDGSTEKVT